MSEWEIGLLLFAHELELLRLHAHTDFEESEPSPSAAQDLDLVC